MDEPKIKSDRRYTSNWFKKTKFIIAPPPDKYDKNYEWYSK
jgi:hypothetical protein